MSRAPRLTDAEWDALLHAIVDSESLAEDNESEETARRLAALERARVKVQEHLRPRPRRKVKATPSCAAGCPCLCHEGLGDVEHPGRPCPGKPTPCR